MLSEPALRIVRASDVVAPGLVFDHINAVRHENIKAVTQAVKIAEQAAGGWIIRQRSNDLRLGTSDPAWAGL